MSYEWKSRTFFVAQLKENQNIIHKICRLYTNCEDSHKDLFQEVTIQLWKAFRNLEAIANFPLGPTA
jgi:RNA polymerase sigma-70 factor (ECF subfamily)